MNKLLLARMGDASVHLRVAYMHALSLSEFYYGKFYTRCFYDLHTLYLQRKTTINLNVPNWNIGKNIRYIIDTYKGLFSVGLDKSVQ